MVPLKNFMSKKSLYLRYRPHNFENLVGQEHISATLINALKTDNVSHAYLFTGPRGTGKTSSARLIAKALNCQKLKDGFEPCNDCDFCNDINTGRLIDLIEIDAASNRGIDEVRDLKEKINFAATRSKYKVYIIDEVHMMTKEAFNALLKTLEEPPSHVYFILATTEVHKIPETIISRCQRFDFRRLTQNDLVKRLKHIAKEEKTKCEDGSLEMIAKYVDGGMRDAIGLLEQLTNDSKVEISRVRSVLGISDLSLLTNLYKALTTKNTAVSLKIIDELHTQGCDLRQFCHDFIDLLRNEMLKAVAENSSAAKFITMIDVFQEAQLKIGGSIPQLALEIAVIKIAGNVQSEPEIISEVPVEQKHEPAAAKKPVSDGKLEEPRSEELVTAAARPEPVLAPITKAVDPKPIETTTSESPKPRMHKTILTMTSINQHWDQILQNIKTPSLRRSIKSAKIVSVENCDISLEFSTSFHRNKVMEHSNRVQLEEVIKDMLGDPVKIIGFIGEGPIPEVEEAPKPTHSEELDMVDSKSNDQVDNALDIFGGEIVG